MTLYDTYVAEIAARAKQGLQPKPIDDGALTAELITHITDAGSAHSKDCLHYLIYNTLPGTTSAAGVKAGFLKDIILKQTKQLSTNPPITWLVLPQSVRVRHTTLRQIFESMLL